MTRQRLTKRQIREDPLVTYVSKVRSWSRRNTRRLLIAAAVVVIAFGGMAAMRSARRGAEAAAATELAQAQYYLWAQSPEQSIQLADDITERWPGTRSARLAQLVKADALLGSGQVDQALTEYDAFLAHAKKQNVYRVAALRGKAVALENAGRPGEAAGLYEELARRTDAGQLTGIDLLAAARCRASAGDTGAARTLYEEVAKTYPDVAASYNVRMKLDELETSQGVEQG